MVSTKINGKWRAVSLPQLLIPHPKKKIKHLDKNPFNNKKNNLFCENIYHDKGTYYEVECFNGDKFKIDKVDYQICRPYVWHINYDKSGYRSVTTKVNGKMIKLHRLILNCLNTKEEVDHVNRDSTDNRRENLRMSNRSQNCYNRRMSKYNTSGTTGVYKINGYNRWGVQINHNEKRTYLGSYDNKQEAIKARKKAELKLYGELCNK